ncbi:hypothetical protein HG536_0F03810 [Torulaspora globosa]|uniref:Uncharacterized protein n=1 Tax=Torulaspora globosa TaxID=48254 RepID=A0A7G3ZKM0_9SACH|nr:uncharacterized protein HG536_0F03810 [Torulaspora globosa]QLL34056.1 hypothetical protein HG536_0F03810 [Torulaspora globosa]
MSFAGSLLLTGVGALVYRYDRSQILRKSPESQFGTKYYKKKYDSSATRAYSVVGNFLNEFFNGSSFLYPLKGVRFFFNNTKELCVPILGVFSLYLLMYFVVSVVYWSTITPVYTALFAIFGPPGLLLAWTHAILQTNLLTMMFMRLCHFNNELTFITLQASGFKKGFNKKPIKYYVPINSVYFWTFHLPWKSLKYFMGFVSLVLLLVVSSIPLIGPLIFTFLISPFIAKIYFSKILRLNGLSNIQRNDEFFDHYGQYCAFGIVAGFLENFPILAGFALCTNTIGGALWGIDRDLYRE